MRSAIYGTKGNLVMTLSVSPNPEFSASLERVKRGRLEKVKSSEYRDESGLPRIRTPAVYKLGRAQKESLKMMPRMPRQNIKYGTGETGFVDFPKTR